MNLKKISHDFLRAGIPAALCAVAGALVTIFAAVRILDRVWAHVEAGVLHGPGLGPVWALVAGVALLGIYAVVQRHTSASRPDESR
ncbi:hypothetical protein ACFV0T_24805 [Streptomyces sp. NPDC059582]|uniref:hypothetical protein n=1 Tax=Streptomyces sp. NPDC059582 TaxID=3346875 RepID=UPI003685A989